MVEKRKLTMKQEEFAEKYVENHGNGTQAALEVYDASSAKSAGVIAAQNLGILSVQERVQELQQEYRQSIIEKLKRSNALEIAIDSAVEDISSSDLKRRELGRDYVKAICESFGKEEAKNIIDNRKIILKQPKR